SPNLNSLNNLNLLTQSIQQDQSEQINNGALKNKRIMSVEDEVDLVMLFKMILESDVGLKVDSFTDPFSVLNNFKLGLYDLILIDIALPKMNGFELYKKIRKLDNKAIICFLTAGEMYYEEVRKQVFPELEANCFIRKPITNEDLIQKVKDILKIQ
ncbi:MAG TPA: response regulator, partial [Nitrososphaeraceae archaeon]|nr:response regulator [Nitrososphaeraceae archaeon]